MLLDENDIATVNARLDAFKAAFRDISQMLNPQTDSGELIAKLNECSRLLDRASFALMVSSLQGTAAATEDEKQENIKHLEQLFVNLD